MKIDVDVKQQYKSFDLPCTVAYKIQNSVTVPVLYMLGELNPEQITSLANFLLEHQEAFSKSGNDYRSTSTITQEIPSDGHPQCMKNMQ